MVKPKRFIRSRLPTVGALGTRATYITDRTSPPSTSIVVPVI